MDFPHVVIGVITYERTYELQIVLDALLEFLDYPTDKLHWVISDDSSPNPDKMPTLVSNPAYQHMTFIRTPRQLGWGGNANFLNF